MVLINFCTYKIVDYANEIYIYCIDVKWHIIDNSIAIIGAFAFLIDEKYEKLSITAIKANFARMNCEIMRASAITEVERVHQNADFNKIKVPDFSFESDI